jgi:hypothetical protein
MEVPARPASAALLPSPPGAPPASPPPPAVDDARWRRKLRAHEAFAQYMQELRGVEAAPGERTRQLVYQVRGRCAAACAPFAAASVQSVFPAAPAGCSVLHNKPPPFRPLRLASPRTGCSCACCWRPSRTRPARRPRQRCSSAWQVRQRAARQQCRARNCVELPRGGPPCTSGPPRPRQGASFL